MSFVLIIDVKRVTEDAYRANVEIYKHPSIVKQDYQNSPSPDIAMHDVIRQFVTLSVVVLVQFVYVLRFLSSNAPFTMSLYP